MNPLFRVMTYNIHSCVGGDGNFIPRRIADVIAFHHPDVVALQEVDVGRLRTGKMDQAREIARLLKMGYCFFPLMRVGEELYGIALLSRHPMALIKAEKLPTLSAFPHIERRGVMWAAIRTNGSVVQVTNTHFGLINRERLLQTHALMGEDWLRHNDCRPPVIACGDFNAVPGSLVYRLFHKTYKDVQLCVNGAKPSKTWPSLYPFLRVDHIFVSPEIGVADVRVPRNHLTRMASDHLPIVADLHLPA
jgi:endonuclease/exonuclease/phosphatase family metal-dependent hydrolase